MSISCTTGNFSRYQAQLDRENAHLILSEAVIQSLNKAYYEKKASLPCHKEEEEDNSVDNPLCSRYISIQEQLHCGWSPLFFSSQIANKLSFFLSQPFRNSGRSSRRN